MPIVLSDRVKCASGEKNAALDALLPQLRSEGRTVIDLTKGELAQRPPQEFIGAAQKALHERAHGYTDAAGLAELRQAVAHYIEQTFAVASTKNEVVVTAGAKQGLFLLAQSLFDPEDEVLILAPYWTTFPEQVRLVGARPVIVDVSRLNYRPRAEAVEAFLTSRTKAIILNSPNNPTGVVYSDDAIAALVRLARAHSIYLIFDQCYHTLSYTDEARAPLGSLINGYERAVIVDAFSKKWGITGWRIGYVRAAPEVVKAMRTLQVHTSSNANCIAQAAVLEVIGSSALREYERAAAAWLREHRDFVVDELGGGALDLVRPEGGFFALIDVSGSARWRQAGDTTNFCRSLLVETGVLVVPGGAFGNPSAVRISFSGARDELRAGLGCFKRFVEAKEFGVELRARA